MATYCFLHELVGWFAYSQIAICSGHVPAQGPPVLVGFADTNALASFDVLHGHDDQKRVDPVFPYFYYARIAVLLDGIQVKAVDGKPQRVRRRGRLEVKGIARSLVLKADAFQAHAAREERDVRARLPDQFEGSVQLS